MKLDPFHPTWFYFPIADHHFERGEYEEALAAARKIDIPGFFWTQIYLAAIYAELGRQSEARSALEELLRLYPGFTIETVDRGMRGSGIIPTTAFAAGSQHCARPGCRSRREQRKGTAMSLEDLGNIGEFVAAVAVVVSLIYLAVQIRAEHAKPFKLRVFNPSSDAPRESVLRYQHAQNAEISDLFARGLNGLDNLDESENAASFT